MIMVKSAVAQHPVIVVSFPLCGGVLRRLGHVSLELVTRRLFLFS